MKVGLYSPMPPAPTGVADYSAALLPYLRAHGDVEPNPASCDVALYHIGNNSLHRESYHQALGRPSVVVLHDAVLNHFFLGFGDRDLYVSEFEYNYGKWAQGLAEDLWNNRARSGSDPRYFEYPMLKRIAESARTVIVHNPAAAARVLKHAPDARVAEIPHFFRARDLPPVENTKSELLIGAFGHQRETKRLHVVLRAFHRAVDAGADAKLLVSGQFLSETYERSLGPLLGHPRILRTGYLPEPEFWRWAAQTDVCANLRYPTAGETSGIAISFMGIGKVVIFTEGDEIARFPEDSCLRLQAGPGEEATLVDYFLWLDQNRKAAGEIGRRAAKHIAEHHAPERIAALYWKVLQANLPAG